MDWNGCEVVETVPGKVSGVPILKHSRVQADTVVESYTLGQSVEEIAYSYGLKAKDVREVLDFAEARSALKQPA